MTDPKTDIERLIVRRLDGELTDEESLALDRELMRDPNARSLCEAYKQIDALAVAALDEAIGGETTFRLDSGSAEANAELKRHRGQRGWWWVAFGAVAAACLALVVPPSSFFGPAGKTQVVDNGSSPRPSIESSVPPPTMPEFSRRRSPGSDLMRNASHLRPSIRRNTGRDVIGIMGDDGNLYWIEVERTRTHRRPSAGVPRPATLEEL